MTDLLGLPLDEALRRLAAVGICPQVLRTVGFHPAAQGRERVVRVQQDGRRLTVACFPDTVQREPKEETSLGKG